MVDVHISLQHFKQESKTISSRASEAQTELQRDKEHLVGQLNAANGEKEKLMEQLREAYIEKGKIEKQLNDHVTAANETTDMLNQNLEVAQKHEEEYKIERLATVAV